MATQATPTALVSFLNTLAERWHNKLLLSAEKLAELDGTVDFKALVRILKEEGPPAEQDVIRWHSHREAEAFVDNIRMSLDCLGREPTLTLTFRGNMEVDFIVGPAGSPGNINFAIRVTPIGAGHSGLAKLPVFGADSEAHSPCDPTAVDWVMTEVPGDQALFEQCLEAVYDAGIVDVVVKALQHRHDDRKKAEVFVKKQEAVAERATNLIHAYEPALRRVVD